MKIGLFGLVVFLVVLSFISANSIANSTTDFPTDPRVRYLMIPENYRSVGGYSAWMRPVNAFALGDSPLKMQEYHWNSLDLFLPGKECVTVGNRVDSATLYFKEGYKWVNDGKEYCLVRD